MVEPSSRIEEFKIPLTEPVHGLVSVPGVLGVPRWWPTGSRVCVVLAHGANSDYTDPLIEYLQRELTERRYLTLRFNFPLPRQKTRPDPLPAAPHLRAARAIARDPTRPLRIPRSAAWGRRPGRRGRRGRACPRRRAGAARLPAPPASQRRFSPRPFRIVSPMLFFRARATGAAISTSCAARSPASAPRRRCTQSSRRITTSRFPRSRIARPRAFAKKSWLDRRLDPEGPRAGAGSMSRRAARRQRHPYSMQHGRRPGPAPRAQRAPAGAPCGAAAAQRALCLRIARRSTLRPQ